MNQPFAISAAARSQLPEILAIYNEVIPDEVMEVLKAHDWPGNIRELQNVIERAVVLSPESILRLALTELKQMTKPQSAAAARTLADAEREHILEVLKQSDWVIGGPAGAATRLGLPRTTLVYKMRKLGIENAPLAPAVCWHSGWRLSRWGV